MCEVRNWMNVSHVKNISTWKLSINANFFQVHREVGGGGAGRDITPGPGTPQEARDLEILYFCTPAI